MRVRILVTAGVALTAVGLGFAADAPKSSHPHFDDKGTLAWSTKLEEAQAAAKASGKLLFIEYGRES